MVQINGWTMQPLVYMMKLNSSIMKLLEVA